MIHIFNLKNILRILISILKELKNLFNANKNDFNLYNEKKLREIGKKLSERNLEELNR